MMLSRSKLENASGRTESRQFIWEQITTYYTYLDRWDSPTIEMYVSWLRKQTMEVFLISEQTSLLFFGSI